MGDNKYSENPALRWLEPQPRQAGKGVWSASNPVPPWDWRDRSSSSGPCSGPDRDCRRLSTRRAVEEFHETHTPRSPHRLDKDANGRAVAAGWAQCHRSPTAAT